MRFIVIHPFYVNHNETVLGPGRETVYGNILLAARSILTRRFRIPTRAMLTTTNEADAHLRFYLSQLDGLPELIGKMKPVFRELLEICHLFIMQRAHECLGRTHSEARSFVVLGAYLQRRLALFLLNLSPTCHKSIFNLGDFCVEPSDKKEWEFTFIGAATYARTIEAFLRTPGTHVYLPTLHEDIEDSIDLIVECPDMERTLCVSIKTGVPGSSLYIEHVWKRPDGEKQVSRDQRKIFDGTIDFNYRNLKEAWPCRLTVGKNSEEKFDTKVCIDDTETLGRFLDRPEPNNSQAEQVPPS